MDDEVYGELDLTDRDSCLFVALPSLSIELASYYYSTAVGVSGVLKRLFRNWRRRRPFLCVPWMTRWRFSPEICIGSKFLLSLLIYYYWEIAELFVRQCHWNDEVSLLLHCAFRSGLTGLSLATGGSAWRSIMSKGATKTVKWCCGSSIRLSLVWHPADGWRYVEGYFRQDNFLGILMIGFTACSLRLHWTA